MIRQENVSECLPDGQADEAGQLRSCNTTSLPTAPGATHRSSIGSFLVGGGPRRVAATSFTSWSPATSIRPKKWHDVPSDRPILMMPREVPRRLMTPHEMNQRTFLKQTGGTLPAWLVSAWCLPQVFQRTTMARRLRTERGSAILSTMMSVGSAPSARWALGRLQESLTAAAVSRGRCVGK